MKVDRLVRGRKFHDVVQSAFLTDLTGATGVREHGWRLASGGRGRVDLAIVTDDHEKMLIIIEIKGTDWDKIRPDRVNRNVQRHIRQLLPGTPGFALLGHRILLGLRNVTTEVRQSRSRCAVPILGPALAR